MTVKAAVYGCIPVIMQDGVHQPFEEVLPYHNFAVRVAETDVASLPHLLNTIAADTNKLSKMQVSKVCYSLHHRDC